MMGHAETPLSSSSSSWRGYCALLLILAFPACAVVQVPKDVDYRVMITFLEFYEALLGFVLFRLYSGLGLHYPPVADPATGAFPLPTATNETSPEERVRPASLFSFSGYAHSGSSDSSVNS